MTTTDPISSRADTLVEQAACGDPVAVVDRAHQVADEVLFPVAQDTDRAELLPAANLRALADAGLFGIAGPVEAGGLALPPLAARRVFAAVGGACGATFFVWAQHHGCVRLIARADDPTLRDEFLDDMCAGRVVAGQAFAHLRRPGAPPIHARRVDGGWRVNGFAPWMTSWGIADLFLIAAETDDREVVWCSIRTPGGDISPDTIPDGVIPGTLPLPVFAPTGTITVRLDDWFVPDEAVVSTEDADRWRTVDRLTVAVGQPAMLGVAARATDLLAAAARGDDEPATGAALRLRDEIDSRWSDDDALMGRILDPPTAHTDAWDELAHDAADHRARCLDVARRSTTALLAAVGGGGMSLTHPAQRLARETEFYVIQGQSADGRAATLRAT